jgi:hypothetical protein
MTTEAAMELVHERTISLRDGQGSTYDRARVYAAPQADGRWGGFIEFVPDDGSPAVRSPRETTQRNVADVAYWATGLEPVYLEGALERALREPATPDDELDVVVSPTRARRTARLEIESTDPTLALRLMGTRTLVPGQRRRVQDTGALVYEGTLRSPSASARGRYAFLAEFGTDTAAALVANVIWSELHGEVAWIAIEGTPVALDHATLKQTLLAAAA